MKFGCCIQKKEDIIKTAELGFDFYEYSGSAVSKISREEFEQMLLLIFDAVILKMSSKNADTNKKMAKRHASIE